jgi:hypothetical protein
MMHAQELVLRFELWCLRIRQKVLSGWLLCLGHVIDPIK